MSDDDTKFGIIDSTWQHWGASILLTVILPLLPLGLEKLISHGISDASLLIAATIYCCSLGLASNSVLVVVMGVLVSVVLSVFYGITTAPDASVPDYSAVIAWVCIAFFAITHSVDRYDLHVTRGRNFLDFRRSEE